MVEAAIREFRRRVFEENFQRIEKCLTLLTEEEIWWRPNTESNSVGNLILHLEGNARQWIVAGLGQQTDIRKRQTEFDEKGPIASAVLLQKLMVLQTDIEAVFSKITETDLQKVYPVQVYQESGISILIHVIEHFSYHVGQIAYFVKYRKALDLHFYEEDLG